MFLRGTHVAPWKFQQGTHKTCTLKFLFFSSLKLPSCGLVVSVDINANNFTEDRNFKTFLKENNAIALDSYIFT